MTYPHQPEQPYGWQPDPYGQGGQPQSGGFPPPAGQPYQGQQYPNQPYQGQQYPNQPYQGQQYPQQGGYDQVGGHGHQPYPPYGQVGGFGGPPPPPRKNKTGLWIGIAVTVVILLGGFVVTAFVVPGFLLGTNSAAGTSPDSTAQAFADALSKKDSAALSSLKCGKVGHNVDLAIAEINKVEAAALSGSLKKVSDTEYTANLNVTTSSSKPSPYIGTFVNESGKWCWKNIERGVSGSRADPPTSTTR